MPSVQHDASAGIITQARNILASEAQSLLEAIPTIGESFARAIRLLVDTRGRVIVTGMGKPGYIAHKISATLASTGTPSFYLHPAEAAHGDLGMVTSSDVILALSNSGETPEILALLPVLKRIGLPIISLCGNENSTLAKHSDVFLSAAVKTGKLSLKSGTYKQHYPVTFSGRCDGSYSDEYPKVQKGGFCVLPSRRSIR